MATGAIPSLQLVSILEPMHSIRPRDVGRLKSQFRQTYPILLHQSRHYAHPHAFFTSRDTRGSRGNTGSFITVTIAEAQRPWWPTMDLSRSRVALHCIFHGLKIELLRTNVCSLTTGANLSSTPEAGCWYESLHRRRVKDILIYAWFVCHWTLSVTAIKRYLQLFKESSYKHPATKENYPSR